MKTKRLLLLLVLTLSSFFFFLDNAKADTYNYTDSDYELITTSTFQHAYEWAVANKPTGYPYIAITWQNYSTKTNYLIAWFSSDSYTFDFCNSSWQKQVDYSYARYSLANDTGVFLGTASYFSGPVNQLSGYMYSDVSFYCPSGSSITQVFDDITYVANDTNKLLSLTEVVNYPRPTPDTTPLLTSFINVVIDRLTFITSSLHSNYILLSCFTIFTLFFIILLFRRLQ